MDTTLTRNKGLLVFHLKANQSGSPIAKDLRKLLNGNACYSMCFIKKGEASFNIGNERHYVSKDNLLLLTPNVKVDVDSTKKSWDIEIYLIVFSLDYTFKLNIQKAFFEISRKLFSIHQKYLWDIGSMEGNSLTTLIRQLLHYQQQASEFLFKEQILRSLAEILFCEITRLATRHIEIMPYAPSKKAELLSNFYISLKDNYAKEHAVQFYANQLGISPKYLTSIAKEFTGKSTIELIHDLLIQESKILLQNHAIRISEISKILSFPDQSFFGKFFKKNTGITPREYRKLKF